MGDREGGNANESRAPRVEEITKRARSKNGAYPPPAARHVVAWRSSAAGGEL